MTCYDQWGLSTCEAKRDLKNTWELGNYVSLLQEPWDHHMIQIQAKLMQDEWPQWEKNKAPQQTAHTKYQPHEWGQLDHPATSHPTSWSQRLEITKPVSLVNWGGPTQKTHLENLTHRFMSKVNCSCAVELCSILCGSLDGREVWREMDTRICMAGSLHCSPETITTLFVNQLYSNTK